MSHVRRIVAVLLVLAGPLPSAPGEADAQPRMKMVPTNQPYVTCELVVSPDGGSVVSAGQSVKVAGPSHRLWMTLKFENRGRAAQKFNVSLVLDEGPGAGRRLLSKTFAVEMASDRSDASIWSVDLDQGTHILRAAGYLDLKDNRAGNACSGGVLNFTVEVGPSLLERSKVVVKPEITCRVSVGPDIGFQGQRSPSAGDVSPGQALSFPGSSWPFSVDITVENQRVMPYSGPVALDIVVDQDGQKRLIGRTQKVGTPLEQDRGPMFRERFTLEAGRHGVRVLITLIVPNNRGANAAGVTPCGDLRFTADVGGTLTLAIQADPPPLVAPGTRTTFTLVTQPGALTKWRIFDGAQEQPWPSPGGPGADFSNGLTRLSWTPSQASPNTEIRAWAKRAGDPDSAAVMARLAFPVVGVVPATIFARDLYPVFSSPRCTNCHGGYAFGPGGHQNGAPVSACKNCHPLPFWYPPTPQQLFAGASATDLCNRFKTSQFYAPPHDAISDSQVPKVSPLPSGLTSAKFLGNLALWVANPASPCQ